MQAINADKPGSSPRKIFFILFFLKALVQNEKNHTFAARIWNFNI